MFFCMTSATEYAPCDELSLEKALAGIAAGNKDSLASLYAQTRTAVYAAALSILKNAHDAEDVLQDTYLRIFSAAATYVPQGKPLAWIVRIARNLALMKLREQKRTAPDDELEMVADGASPLVAAEHRAMLQAAAEALSDEELQIVMLHAVSGLRHREIAALLKKPAATVLSKYARAIKKLSARLHEGEITI